MFKLLVILFIIEKYEPIIRVSHRKDETLNIHFTGSSNKISKPGKQKISNTEKHTSHILCNVCNVLRITKWCQWRHASICIIDSGKSGCLGDTIESYQTNDKLQSIMRPAIMRQSIVRLTIAFLARVNCVVNIYSKLVYICAQENLLTWSSKIKMTSYWSLLNNAFTKLRQATIIKCDI